MGTALVSPISSDQWRTLRISAIGDIVRVSIDGVEVISAQDTAPLPPGTISFAGIGASGLLVDDFGLWIPIEEPTAEPTVTPTEAFELNLVDYSDFDTYDRNTSPWLLRRGWSVIPNENGQAVRIGSSNLPAEFLIGQYADVAVEAHFLLNGGSGNLSVRRSYLGEYKVSIDSSGTLTLLNWQTVLGTAPIAIADDEWYTVRLVAIGSIVRVLINNVEVIQIQDADPLPRGSVTFGAQELGENGFILVDDVSVWGLEEVPQTARAQQLLMSMSTNPIIVDTLTQEISPFVQNGNCSLGEAIQAANTDQAVDGCAAGDGADTIILNAQGTYTLTNFEVSSPNGNIGLPVITSNITIQGNGNTIERSGTAPNFRILYQNTGTLTLNNIIIKGGNVSGDGGGIYHHNGVLIIEAGSMIQNNTAGGAGGGIYSSDDLTITDSIISTNTAYDAGGIFTIISSGESVTFTNSSISDNQSDDGVGGGLWNFSAVGQALNINQSRIVGNTNTGSFGGGGLHFSGGGGLNERKVNFNCIQSNVSGDSEGSAIWAFGAVDAENNWWGSAGGPTTGMITNSVDAVPYLTATPGSCSAPRESFTDIEFSGDDEEL